MTLQGARASVFCTASPCMRGGTRIYVLYRAVFALEVVQGSLYVVPLWPYKVHVQLRAVQYSPCMRGTVWSLHHRWYIDLGMLYLCDRTRCACLNVLYGTVLEWEVVHGSLYVVLLWHCKVHVPLCSVPNSPWPRGGTWIFVCCTAVALQGSRASMCCTYSRCMKGGTWIFVSCTAVTLQGARASMCCTVQSLHERWYTGCLCSVPLWPYNGAWSNNRMLPLWAEERDGSVIPGRPQFLRYYAGGVAFL